MTRGPNKSTIYSPETGSRTHTKEYNKKLYARDKKKMNQRNIIMKKTRPSDEMKKKVLDRDNHECQICRQKTHLGLHHANGDRSDNSFWNLLTVCPSCH